MEAQTRQAMEQAMEQAQVGDIIHVGAFWKNDQARGIGFERVFIEGGKQFAAQMKEALAAYDQGGAEPEDLIEQLQEMGADGKWRSDEQLQIVVFMNIYWLEQRGHLQPDEYNGVRWTQRLK